MARYITSINSVNKRTKPAIFRTHSDIEYNPRSNPLRYSFQ